VVSSILVGFAGTCGVTAGVIQAHSGLTILHCVSKKRANFGKL